MLVQAPVFVVRTLLETFFFLPRSVDHLFIFLKFYNFSMSVLRFTIFLGRFSENLQDNPVKAKFAVPNIPKSSPMFQSGPKQIQHRGAVKARVRRLILVKTEVLNLILVQQGRMK